MESTHPKPPTIRVATPADLACVLEWLKHEHETEPEGSFWVNAETIRKGFEDLTVALDPETNAPVAFCLADTHVWNCIHILAVRKTNRRQGVGNLLTPRAGSSRRPTGPVLRLAISRCNSRYEHKLTNTQAKCDRGKESLLLHRELATASCSTWPSTPA